MTSAEKQKRYRNTPNGKLKIKLYRQKPEVKIKMNEWHKRPEIRARYNTPEFKQKKKQWNIKNHDRILDLNRNNAKEFPKKFWAINTLQKHRQKGYKIGISRIDLERLIGNIDYCQICNVKLDYIRNGKGLHDLRATLDDLDNSHEITVNNIQILCLKCNRTKSNRSMSEFIDYCKHVASLSHCTEDNDRYIFIQADSPPFIRKLRDEI